MRYLFLGKSGAILLGFPDTTQDADVFVERTLANGLALVAALRELGFTLTDAEADEIARGKDFVQLKNGPFDLDLVFAPDGIETFADAWRRRVEVEGLPDIELVRADQINQAYERVVKKDVRYRFVIDMASLEA